MAASDLALLADVKAWLTVSNATDDALLSRLITDLSGAICAYLSRPSLIPRTVAERYDGNGKSRLYLRQFPVVAIASLLINDNAIAAAPAPTAGASFPQSGYLLSPWDGAPPGKIQAIDLFGSAGHFWLGRQNVVVTYTAGYQVSGESATVPLAPGPYTVTVQAPYGPWASDAGVVYASGVALTPVAQSPAAGQYSVAGGIYIFAAADAGAGLLISYGFIPAAINGVCIEWVAERYKYRQHIGQSSQSVQGQQTAAYSLKAMPDFVKALIDPYRNVVP